MAEVTSILKKALDGDRLDFDDAVALLKSDAVEEIGAAADEIRARWHPDGIVSFIVDRNINYTNVCVARCTFCNFYRKLGDEESYILDKETIFKKIEEMIELGGTGILMQGGMHPHLKIDYYEDLLRSIRARYSIQLHCFSPPEIVVLAKLSKLSLKQALARLRAAGLTSLPGGGAEILVERMRDKISPGKCTADEWLQVMRDGHSIGLKTTATMMVGGGETVEERVEHLRRLRALQDESGGFVAFIPWNVQLKGTEMSAEIKEVFPSREYLKLLAVSRLFLDNFRNIQVSWLTQGLEVGRIGLRYGANDIGSVMIEENVISTAGAHHRATREKLIEVVRSAGFTPVQRDCTYSTFRKIA
ncbi:MAG TPA: cyclic dehypoxanthinyl futalosine synthase [Acidobacteriota bacterium]|nr:cyclic dehypoxanthinyl futalosine synthase [Acidobacteriota bacterium]